MGFLRTLILILLYALALALFLFIAWLNIKAFCQVFRPHAEQKVSEARRAKHSPRRFSPPILLNSLLVVTSLLIGLLLSEVILHGFVSVKTLGFSGPEKNYRFHPRLLFQLNPDLPHTQRIGGVTLYEPKVDQRKTRYRLLILGDSFSESGPRDHRWPNVLRRLIKKAHLGDRIEIINAATAAYSAWQEKVSLQILAPILQPDLVIATWVPNDNCADLMYVGEGLGMAYPGDTSRLHDRENRGYGPLESLLIRRSRIYQLFLRWVVPKFQRPGSRDIVGSAFLLPPKQMGREMMEHHVRQLKEIRDIAIKQGSDYASISPCQNQAKRDKQG